MNTLIRIIVSSIVGLLMLSCNINGNYFGTGVSGSRNVVTEERSISGNFDEIKVSRGLDVYITQGDNVSLSVQADDNLHDIIITEVENNVLKIYADDNIRSSASKKVIVSFTSISKIKASSGSDVFANNTITADELDVQTSSGSDMELDVNTRVLNCSSSSGSDLKLSGTTKNLYAEASSGSDIKAGNLKAEKSQVRASSGADITVNTSKELVAKASSGGDIKYYGNPEKVDKTDGVSGSIRKQ